MHKRHTVHPLASPLLCIHAAAARPPWTAEVSKMQEQFSTTVNPVHKKSARPVRFKTAIFSKLRPFLGKFLPHIDALLLKPVSRCDKSVQI
jgi:hypothetical protein